MIFLTNEKEKVISKATEIAIDNQLPELIKSTIPFLILFIVGINKWISWLAAIIIEFMVFDSQIITYKNIKKRIKKAKEKNKHIKTGRGEV